MKQIAFFMIVALLSMPTVCSAQIMKSTLEDQRAVEVTVYNSNIGLVKDLRTIDLPKGVGELQFMDVASSIKPVTVVVKSLSAPDDFMVLEQNYEYDLMHADKLLDKYVGKHVKIIDENRFQGTEKEVDAVLLSNNSGQIYRIDNEIHLGCNGRVILPEIPENLIAKPTLTWLYENDSSKSQELEVSYLTNDIKWIADYVMTVSNDDATAGLNGWVSIDNRTGTEYREATLKLVAGDVNRVEETRNDYEYDKMKKPLMAQVGRGFQEESFFEYHIYDLQRPTTIKNNQTKQISLLGADELKIEKEFVVHGDRYFYQGHYEHLPKVKVGVFLKFKNEEDNQLGMPLPAGTIRLYKEDSKGKLQFIGEDRIAHTPKDEEITLRIGDAFDIVAERKQTDYQKMGRKAIETAWEMTVRNHKDEDCVVSIIEPMVGEWSIKESSHAYEKRDAHTITFAVPVPNNGEAKLTYRVRIVLK